MIRNAGVTKLQAQHIFMEKTGKNFYPYGYTETVLFRECGEYFILQQTQDGGVKGRKGRPEGLWVADWAGCDGICPVGINGNSREEVIEKMCDIIGRKKALYSLQRRCAPWELKKTGNGYE